MVLGNGSHDESQVKRGCLGTGEGCEKSSHTPHKLELDGLERLRENHEENTGKEQIVYTSPLERIETS